MSVAQPRPPPARPPAGPPESPADASSTSGRYRRPVKANREDDNGERDSTGLVVTSGRSGDASTLVSVSVPEDLYAELVRELPNCAVLDSILLTQRASLELEETPDAALARVEQTVQRWKASQSEQRQRAADCAVQDGAAETAARESFLAVEDDKRAAKITDLEHRISALLEAVQRDSARVTTTRKAGAAAVAADGGPPAESPFRKEWELLQIRKLERDREAAKECKRIVTTEAARQSRESELEFSTALAKLGINEQLTRCALYSEQETARLYHIRSMASGQQRLAFLCDTKAYIQSRLMDVEKRERQAIRDAFIHSI